jgi:hypothetical protein
MRTTRLVIVTSIDALTMSAHDEGKGKDGDGGRHLRGCNNRWVEEDEGFCDSNKRERDRRWEGVSDRVER